MGMGVDMLFILFLALILFGPKRLPEIARQVGKFVAEFKRASNDFKYQLQAEIDKAGVEAPAAYLKSAEQSSPSTPTLDPSAPKTDMPGTPLLPPAETSPATSPAESEHERLMRTARMAYEAQAFTLRPPEPHSYPSTPPTGIPETPTHPSTPPTGVPETSTPSAPNSAPAGDSHPQSANSGQIGGPAAQGS